MTTDTKDAGQTTTQATEGENQERLTLADVLGGGRRALSFLGEIPWVALGVITTGIGASVMFVYFRSIAFTPPDLSAVVGAGAAIGVVLFVFLLFAVWAFAAPHWLFAVSGSLNQVAWRPWPGHTWREANNFVMGAQVLGAGAFFAYLGWSLWVECKPGSIYGWVPAGVLLALGGTTVAHAGWGRVRMTWGFVSSLALLLLLGALSLLFLLGLLLPSSSASHWQAAIWLLSWLGMVGLLGSLPARMPAWAPFLIVLCVLPVLLVYVPAFGGNADAVPKRVMELAGIRSAKTVELRVPASTCELIADAARVTAPCASPTGWSTVHAEVLSNLGSRWWIEVRQLGEQALPASETLRVSIPAAEVQIVQRQTAAQTNPYCARGSWFFNKGVSH